MLNILEENTMNKDIRKHFDHETGVLYLSIVDVIERLSLSTDPRNYWKTLKNRLKNTQKELVTKCNQLKMRASDGKMYLTDTADADTILILIQQLAPEKVGEFRRIFRETYSKELKNTTLDNSPILGLSTEEKEDYELSIDLYQNKDFLNIQVMLAGVEIEDISIVATTENVLIKGARRLKKVNLEYITEELAWGKFSREVNLPEEIDIDAIETNFNYGMLHIKLPIIDKTRTRIIKIKN